MSVAPIRMLYNGPCRLIGVKATPAAGPMVAATTADPTGAVMSYKSILVNLDIDGPIGPIVKAAADLAGRSQARLVGFCAADALFPMTAPGGEALAAEAWQQMRDDIEARFKELRGEFEALVAGAVATEWRDALDSPTRALAQMARTADLIVAGAADGVRKGDTQRLADPGSVVLQAGRPLLVVAAGAERLAAGRIVVAWKDAREARRAVADAVPLLKAAEEVAVVTVVPEADEQARGGIADVAAFLAGPGVEARAEAIESPDDSDSLLAFIDTFRADLVVSGAYGHSRLREWAFGGVTRSLLDEIAINRFMAS
jgi:nucleotide-binding universal stress UspA family protein